VQAFVVKKEDAFAAASSSCEQDNDALIRRLLGRRDVAVWLILVG
tara:strand:+ start:841 stop:975 length:135 start_codon:yes stop_codon:yes gene_type:complete